VAHAITGAQDHLHPYLAAAIERAECIRMIVAFVMESGTRLIAPDLKRAAARGVPIRLLTGQYLQVTEPSALYHLRAELGAAMDIRFYDGDIRAFHPKAYILDYQGEADVFVGSSNLSRSALTTGVEWNYQFRRSEHPHEYARFSDTFEALFHRHSQRMTEELLKSYALKWKKPALVRSADEEVHLAPDPTPRPRGAQIEALYYLRQAREEGVDKGLVVAATGVGKTHLAAFDSAQFGRVLFLAHRQEIVDQAHEVFRSIRPESRFGLYTGERKDEDAGVYFATVQTLSRDEHLQVFPPDYFDYVVVDEFHHAAADSYRKVIDHFRPRFLLGMTATPFRMDNKDIFALCEDNVIYEISLKQSIERDLLAPFRYYAVYDPTNYDEVRMANGSYVIEDLERQLSHKERADLILRNYMRLGGERTLAFCASISHAEYMAAFFSEHSVPAAAIHSEQACTDHPLDRATAIDELECGRLKVVFAVDMFNEGVDIPSLDTVMFLRPTESFVVFLQQLGRGLRKYPGKSHCTVIDFIGNYRRAHYLPRLLAGENPWADRPTAPRRAQEYEFPEGCSVSFDLRVIELFDELAARDPLPVRMLDTYRRIKHSLGRRPTRLDIYQGSDIPIKEYLKRGWLRFLESAGDLDAEEATWLGGPAEEFLREVERTHLTKAYKLPTIGAFLRDDGGMSGKVGVDEIGRSMMRFYVDHPLHQKDLSNDSNRGWQQWSVDDFTRLARRNPVTFLSRGRFFKYDEVDRVMHLSPKIHPHLTPSFAWHVQDILEFRRIDYFRRRFKD
jgi:superfamily II DNA or RNA helicase/HKD family nuclease